MKALMTAFFGMTAAFAVHAHESAILSTSWIHELAHFAPALPFALLMAVAIGVSVKFTK